MPNISGLYEIYSIKTNKYAKYPIEEIVEIKAIDNTQKYRLIFFNGALQSTIDVHHSIVTFISRLADENTKESTIVA